MIKSFLFKKSKSSANAGLSLVLFLFIKWPPALKTHSEGTDEAVVQKTN